MDIQSRICEVLHPEYFEGSDDDLFLEKFLDTSSDSENLNH